MFDEPSRKQIFELFMIDLLKLPKGITSFTLKCAYNSIPIVSCEYEVQDGDFPKVRDGNIVIENKTYKINLEEIEEKLNEPNDDGKSGNDA